jgi:thiosulfate/3-mercaptopyruvate sulfurtransferase
VPYTNPHYLVETDWLEEHLDDADLRIFDVTGMLAPGWVNTAKERSYDKGHIAGAAFLDVASARSVLSDPHAPLRWTWPSQEHFEAVMGRAGVGNDSHVVLYASTAGQRIYNNTMWCTRAWWIMHHFGVRAAVLNGSLEKWVSEGRPVSTSPGTYPATTFTASPQWRRGLASKEDVLAALRDPRSACVVDALSTASFAGTEPLPDGRKKGHITAAVNVPMHVLVDRETGVFASADDIRAHFERAGALPARRVITYCGGAIAATVDAFALALLGYTDVAVYDGSLNEWGLDPSLPMTDPSSAHA